MTIDPNSDIFKAILSVDSYNRGYNAGIVFGSDPGDSEAVPDQTQIGAATVYRSDEDATAKASGFYAIVYQLPDNSVAISYRGTDHLSSSDGIGSEITNAYPVALGLVNDATQANLAFQFYNAVAKTMPGYTDVYNANITLTGHSSGGGLAGLVADTYSKEAVVFDNMPFELSATALYSERGDASKVIVNDAYGVNTQNVANVPNPNGVTGYYLQGDFLTPTRGWQEPQPQKLTPGEYLRPVAAHVYWPRQTQKEKKNEACFYT